MNAKSLWAKMNPRYALDTVKRVFNRGNGLTAMPQPAPNANPLMGFLTPAAQVRWLGPGVAWYTPQKVEYIFRQALAGDLQSQWELFDLMEATSPRLSKNLNQLKDAVIGAELCVQPYKVKGKDATPEAQRRAMFIQEVLETMNSAPEKDENDFEDTLRDVMDARGKGHSVLEIDWETRPISTGMAIGPRCTRWVHPAWYGYPFGPGDASLKLRLGPFSEYMSTVTAGPVAYSDFPPDKFIIGICKNKTGHPLGTAMLHTLGFWWACANFSGEWLLNLAQIYGQPIRWATYASGMTPSDQSKLLTMLATMGSSAYAAFPEGTNFELKEAMKNAGDSPQKVLLDYYDKQCDLVILRQTLTSDVSQDAGSRAQGEVHERILGEAERACMKWTCKTLQPLVKSICRMNFGDLQECPRLAPPIEEEDDSEELATTLSTVAQAGLEPTDAALPEISKRLGFDVQRKALPEPAEDPEDDSPPALSAKSSPPVDNAEVNAIAAARAPKLAAALTKNFSGVKEIVLASKSKAEMEAKLAAYFADWRPREIIEALQPALEECAAQGAIAGISDTTKTTTP